jgi:hypothetical protein
MTMDEGDILTLDTVSVYSHSLILAYCGYKYTHGYGDVHNQRLLPLFLQPKRIRQKTTMAGLVVIKVQLAMRILIPGSKGKAKGVARSFQLDIFRMSGNY